MMDKMSSMIGLAQRAGKIVSGETACEKNIKTGKAVLVIVAKDCSRNTLKHFTDMCTYRSIPIIQYSTIEQLGKMTGKGMRAVLAVVDSGFGNILMNISHQMSIGGEVNV